MKKIMILLVALVSLSGCASLYPKDSAVWVPSTTYKGEQTAIGIEKFENLRGNFTVYSVMLYFTDALARRDGFSTDVDLIVLKRFVLESGASYFALQHSYSGARWRFLKGLDVALDGELYNFEDKQPSRSVAGTGVSEILSYRVDDSFVEKLTKARAIRFQFFLEPVSMTQRIREDLADVVAVMKSLDYLPPRN